MATTIWRRFMAAGKAFVSTFKEEGVTVSFDDPDNYTDVAARRMRYAIYWAMYENTTYRNVHKWAQVYREKYGLYKYIRNIYNPAYRLGEFWVSHLMGGSLDLTAGPAGACPIAMDRESPALRAAIARLWRDSNWGVQKDIFTLNGSIMGDSVLRVNDDTAKGRVYLEVVHPGDVTECTFDAWGNVKAYRIDQTRKHPEHEDTDVIYSEIGTNEGMGNIHYQTLLNNAPYPWDGESAEWDVPYGFVPLVIVRHHNVGLPWGWSEIHPVRSKMHEADDQASLINDQVRKTVNAPGLFSGVTPPSDSPTLKGAAATRSKPEPGRDEIPAMYAKDPAAKWTPMVAPIDWAGVGENLTRILGEIENEYPELHYDRLRQSGDLSGEALRVARQPCEQKVRARRVGYDDGLRRAQQMAVAIGGFRGYDGYQGFSLDSYQAGALDHAIADRAVFGVDEIEKLSEETAFWNAATAAQNAGYPIEMFLADHGWDEAKIKQMYGYTPEQ